MFRFYCVIVSACAATLLAGCISPELHDQMVRERNQAIATKKTLETQKDRLEKETLELTTQLNSARGKNTQLDTEKTALEGEKKELQDKLGIADRKCDEKVAIIEEKHKGEVTKLNEQIDGLDKQVKDLTAQAETLTKAIGTLTRKLEVANETIQKTKKQLDKPTIRSWKRRTPASRMSWPA